MSWITDLAGKAEGLLNQLDQSAASTLQKASPVTGKNVHKSHQRTGSAGVTTATVDSSFVSTGNSSVAFQNEFMTPKAQIGGINSSADSVVYSSRREQKSSGYASSVSSLLSKKEIKEEQEEEDNKLIAYLNQPDPDDVAVSQSRKSSSSSLRSLPAQLFKVGDERMTEIKKEQVSVVQSSTAATPVAEYNFSTKNERELKELKAKEADLEKALQAKDSQLAVLRVRLQEADDQLQTKTRLLSQLRTEKDRLLKDSADSTEVRNNALDTLQKQVQDAQAEVEREKQNAKRAETEYLSRFQRMEEEVSVISQQLTAEQKALTEEKLKAKDAVDQLRLAKYNLEANKHEFDEYKQKAQRILQSKEKLITTLKEGAGIGEGEEGSLAVELEELRAERDILKEDLQQGQLQIYNLKAELQELESQLAAEQRSSLEQQRSLQEQCQTYQHSASHYREQLEHLKLEYQYTQDELRRQQLALQGKLHEKDAEIARVMNQTAARSLSASSNVELEQRIRHLTENLIQKQTLIEALQTDKHSLSLQLERIDKMYREAESAAMRATSTSVHIGGNEEAGPSSRIPHFLRETPYDTSVTKGMKKAYSTVDSFSVRIGLFLRRYPVARIFMFVYMVRRVDSGLSVVRHWPVFVNQVLLHLWVMIVLLTYTPEIHPPGYQPQPPGKLG